MQATTRRVDWPQVIAELIVAGLTRERIAAECLRSKFWVENLRSTPGYEPRHRDGLVVLELWAQAYGRLAIEAPRVQPPISS